MLHCKGVWVLGKRGGGGRGRWGGPYEVPVSAPGPVPGGRQCQPFVFVPLTEGVAAPPPLGFINGDPERQRDQLNGPTRAALTADARTKSREQVLQREEVSNVHKRGAGGGGGAEEEPVKGKQRVGGTATW